jgi:hypothetical protein
MLQIRNPAICSCPTRKRPSPLARYRQERCAQHQEDRGHDGEGSDQAQQHERKRRCVGERELHQRPVSGPADDDDRQIQIDDARPCRPLTRIRQLGQNARSGDLVHREFLRNAAQPPLLMNRSQAARR